MSKLILLSGVLMSIWLPVMYSRDHRQGRGLRRAVVGIALFNLVWLFLALVVYPRISG